MGICYLYSRVTATLSVRDTGIYLSVQKKRPTIWKTTHLFNTRMAATPSKLVPCFYLCSPRMPVSIKQPATSINGHQLFSKPHKNTHLICSKGKVMTRRGAPTMFCPPTSRGLSSSPPIFSLPACSSHMFWCPQMSSNMTGAAWPSDLCTGFSPYLEGSSWRHLHDSFHYCLWFFSDVTISMRPMSSNYPQLITPELQYPADLLWWSLVECTK